MIFFCISKLKKFHYHTFLTTAFNPISPGGGGGGGFHNNSKTVQDMKMKFFKFNLTPMGVIFDIIAILINLRCCHGNLSF